MKQNLSSFISLLEEYISFKSISTDSAFNAHIASTVYWLKQLFVDAGFAVKIIQGPKTNPVIVAEYHISKDKKTLLIYGHYDVQPAAVEDGWKHDPFKLREEGGRLIGRGVVDNKGQNLIHIFKAIELIKKGTLSCNLKFMLEGNEETSNPDMTALVRDSVGFLSCDRVLVSDGEILGNTPTIEETLRGGGNLTLRYTSGKNDLHSGNYGSAVPSSAKELIALLSKMLLPDGTVTIPGFYDDADKVSSKQEEKNRGLSQISNPIEAGGVKVTIGKCDFYTTVGCLPAIEVSGLSSGYVGNGYKNIIPHTAMAKLNFRMVVSQSPELFEKNFRDYIAANTPGFIDYEISFDKLSYPVRLDVNTQWIKQIMKWQEEIYKKVPAVKNVGGGIPVVVDFKTMVCNEIALVPFGNNDCNMHGAEENFRIDLIEKGLELSEQILSE